MRLLVFLVPCALLAQTPQRREGDWVVRTAETVTGGAMVMAGSIIVEAGGVLTLTGVALTFEERKPQPYRIEAKTGSSLTITGATLAGSGYTFLVDGAKFTLRKSTVSGMDAKGLTLRNTTGAILEENDFTGGAASAVHLEKSREALIRRNRFADASPAGNQGGLTFDDSHANALTRNTFVRTNAAFSASHANELTENSVLMTGLSTGFYFTNSGYNVIARNAFEQDEFSTPSCFAVRILQTPHRNYVLDNTVDGIRYAILVSYADGTVVAGNRIRGMTDPHVGAIHVFRARKTEILNNTIADSASGILLFGGSGNAVLANRVTQSNYGIALVYSNANTIAGNILERNTDNLHALDSRGNVMERNDLVGQPGRVRDTSANTWRFNYFEGMPGLTPTPIAPAGMDTAPRSAAGRLVPAEVPAIEKRIPETAPAPNVMIDRDTIWENCTRELGTVSISSGAKLTIRRCTLQATAAGDTQLYASPGTTLEILNSTLLDSPNAAIQISAAAGARLVIRDSKFRGISPWAGGIVLEGDDAVIENNEFADGYTGIRIESTRGHRIVNNRFLRNVDGLFGSGEGLTIEGNFFSGNLMSGSDLMAARSRLAGNHIEHSLKGPIVGANSELRDNVIAHTATPSLSISPGATIAGNSFVQRGAWCWANFCGTMGGYGVVGKAAWDVAGRGNYWSDYRGQDLDGNGIGDTPFDTIPGVLDRYPLMHAAPAACQPLPGAAEVWIPAAGGTVTVATDVAGNCALTVVAQDAWLSATAGGTVVNLEAAANPARVYRATAVTIGGRLVRVYQHPAGCTYALSSTRFDAQREANALQVKVSAPAGCPWSVTGAPWWSLPDQRMLAGVGDGEALLPIPLNQTEARGATVLIAGQALSLAQAASGPAFRVGAVVNAASGVAGGQAPGTLVSIYGTRLGPLEGAAAALPEKGLGGTRVFVHGAEAFLTYAGWNQANVLLPNGLPPGAQVVLRTEYRQAEGTSVPLDVAPAAPGIFTLDGSGFGAAVVVNQDNTFNSSKNPAARGSVVTFFATGFGLTDPALTDGKHPVAPAFPKPALPAFVYVGGREMPAASVLFVGAILTGVLQVNVRLPQDAPVGDAVPLTLRFDGGGGSGYNSQPGVVLAVK